MAGCSARPAACASWSARLGSASVEAIEAFLAQALAYEQSHPPSLQGFLHWLRADSTELIRDPDRPRSEVRVLTVHGAKGLEAPIVFVVDSTFVPEFKDCLLWHEPEGLPLWRMGSKARERVTQAAYQRARARQLEEQRRLLYVGLTRAREHLIVAGCERKSGKETDLARAGRERARGAGRGARRDEPDPGARGRGLAPRRSGQRRAAAARAGARRAAAARARAAGLAAPPGRPRAVASGRSARRAGSPTTRRRWSRRCRPRAPAASAAGS